MSTLDQTVEPTRTLPPRFESPLASLRSPRSLALSGLPRVQQPHPERLGRTPYYSGAVKSMLGSLHNFFFRRLRPGRPWSASTSRRLALWLQTISAKGLRVLELQPGSCRRALCAVLAVFFLYRIIAPRFGVPGRSPLRAGRWAVFPSFRCGYA